MSEWTGGGRGGGEEGLNRVAIRHALVLARQIPMPNSARSVSIFLKLFKTNLPKENFFMSIFMTFTWCSNDTFRYIA